jgi:hypothetical protein
VVVSIKLTLDHNLIIKSTGGAYIGIRFGLLISVAAHILIISGGAERCNSSKKQRSRKMGVRARGWLDRCDAFGTGHKPHPTCHTRAHTQADQLVGAALLAVAVAVLGYYTIWVMVLVRVRPACHPMHTHTTTPTPTLALPPNRQPFIDPKNGGAAIHRFFPPRYYAIAVPTILLAAFVGLVTCFIGLTMLKTAAVNRAKQQQQQQEGKGKKKKTS